MMILTFSWPLSFISVHKEMPLPCSNIVDGLTHKISQDLSLMQDPCEYCQFVLWFIVLSCVCYHSEMNSACFTQGVCFHITYLFTRATSVWRAWCNMLFVPSCIGKRFSHCITGIFTLIKHFRDCLCPVYKDIVILEQTTSISIKIIIQRIIGFDSKLICIDLGVNASSKTKC